MKHCTREILATDGLLGFYNASKDDPHNYARIQFKMTTRKVMEQMASFLRQKLCLEVPLRFNTETIASPYVRPCHTLQINRSEDIETWRRAIGFSNPSHITRMMMFEQLGECPPRTCIVDRLAFLSGCSNTLKAAGPIPESAFKSVVSAMNREDGSPISEVHQMMKRIKAVNERLRHLNRELPRIFQLTS